MKKETKTVTKAIANYLKNIGIQVVLKECNYNMRMVRNRLFRECSLPKGCNWYYYKKQFDRELERQYFTNNKTTYNLIDRFLYKNFGGYANDNIIF